MFKLESQKKLEADIHVTSIQLIVLGLFIVIMAGILVSTALDAYHNLKGGAKVWQSFLFIGIVYSSTLIIYSIFKYKIKSSPLILRK